MLQSLHVHSSRSPPSTWNWEGCCVDSVSTVPDHLLVPNLEWMNKMVMCITHPLLTPLLWRSRFSELLISPQNHIKHGPEKCQQWTLLKIPRGQEFNIGFKYHFETHFSSIWICLWRQSDSWWEYCVKLNAQTILLYTWSKGYKSAVITGILKKIREHPPENGKTNLCVIVKCFYNGIEPCQEQQPA